jgi:hypothetical protein
MLSFYICRWHFGNPGNLDRMVILILLKNLLKRIFFCVFRFCHGRLYFCVRMPLIDLSLVNLDSSCNEVKLLLALNKACIVKTIL